MDSWVMMSTTFDVSRLRTSFKSESNNPLTWDNKEDESSTCYQREIIMNKEDSINK